MDRNSYAKGKVGFAPAESLCWRALRRTREDFTLIELLVAITVIAILASMLLPVLSRAKASARQVLCINNLHQLALATDVYVGDYDQEYPPPSGWVTGYNSYRISPHDANWVVWDDHAPYIGYDPVFTQRFNSGGIGNVVGSASSFPMVYRCPFLEFTGTTRLGYGYWGMLEQDVIEGYPNDRDWGFGDVSPAFKKKYARRGCDGDATVWADICFWGHWDKPTPEAYAHTTSGAIQSKINRPATGFADFELINIATVDGAVTPRKPSAAFTPSSSGNGWAFRYFYGPMYYWF